MLRNYPAISSSIPCKVRGGREKCQSSQKMQKAFLENCGTSEAGTVLKN
jgi:hypothetical protein